MCIIKLNLFPVPVRYGQIEMSSFSHHVLLYLRTLYIVWRLVRRRVTRRRTRFQTMHSAIKIAKHYKTVVERLRLIFQFTYVQYCTKVYTRLIGSVVPAVGKSKKLKMLERNI